jgi:hypothetical protein
MENEMMNEGSGAVLEAAGKRMLTRDRARALAGRMKKPALGLLILLGWIALIQFQTAERYQAKVAVGEPAAQAESIGAEDQLDYGRMPKGDTSTRFISLTNGGERDVYIRVMETGSIAGIMKLEEKSFILRAGESRQLDLAVSIPKETKKGAYSGTVIIFKIPGLF